MSRRHPFIVAAALAVCTATTAFAMDQALGSQGANIGSARTLFGVNGNNVNLGQVEGGRPGDVNLALPGQPGVPETNHPDINPGRAGVGVAYLNTPAIGGTNVDAHAASVAGIMISTNATYTGAAPQAALYSSAFGLGTPDQQLATLSTEWVRAQNGGVHTINLSFGVGLDTRYYPGAQTNRDARSLYSNYIDYSARVNDVLYVQAGPETGPVDWSTPDDSYNSIIVSFSQQALSGGTGRWDRLHPASLTNQVWVPGANPANAPTRTRIDICAPGDMNILPVAGGGYTRDTFTDVNADGAWNGRRRDGNGNGFWDAYEPFVDNNNNNQYDVGDFYFDTNFNRAYDGPLNGDYFHQPGAGGLPLNSEPIADVDGDRIINFAHSSLGTSFAAPMVSGTAALIDQYATANGFQINRLYKKAALMNGASKHVMGRAAVNTAPVPGGLAAAGLASIWPRAYQARNGGFDPTMITQPLDQDTGVGQLNAVSAIRNYRPDGTDIGVHTNNVDATGGANDERSLTLNNGLQLKAGALVTATLVWERIVTNGAGNLLNPGAYAQSAPTDLDLELYRNGVVAAVARSRSTDDNAEHIYFNVPADGVYTLKVRNFGGDAATYGLALSTGTSEGLNFSVAPASLGRNALIGNNPWPNDVNSLGTSGAANYRTEGEIFTSSANGTNMQRLSGGLGTESRVGPHNAPPAALSLLGQRGVLGLRNSDLAGGTDNLRDFSWGTDGTANTAEPAKPFKSTLLFSVTASPDIRKSKEFEPFGTYASSLNIAPTAAGFAVHLPGSAVGLRAADDLDGLEMDSVFRDPDGAGPMKAVDLDGDGIANARVYFTLKEGSPSLTAAGFKGRDILMSDLRDPSDNFDLQPSAAFSFSRFANGGADIGLADGDSIDALVLCDQGVIGTMDAGDLALFSLTADSPSVTGAAGADAGAVYYTSFNGAFDPTKLVAAGGNIFASAADLGIAGQDLDALDIAQVPEPATLAVISLTVGLLAGRRRRRA